MDLYGSGASIAQANSQTQQAREINQATQDFNNTLAEQLDNAKTAQNEEQTDITVKNMASVVTSGGKLIASAEARDDVVKAAQKLKGAPKAIVSKSPFKLGVESSEDLRPLVQSSADVAEGAAQRGAAILAGEGAEGLGPAVISRAAQSGSIGEAAGAVAKGVGFKSAEELGAAGFAKGAFAGIGGGIDIVKDIERGNFGSNSAQRIGNIGNIVGSALEVAGIVTSFTPFGLGLEGLGAAISFGSSAIETGGDIAAGSDQAKTTEEDITSQARGDVAADVVTQAVGRTQ